MAQSTAKREVTYDLMRGGAGTPWENRGEHGIVGGFVKSATRAVFSPGLLFDHIRSTTMTTDSHAFLWICAACWGVGTAIFKAINFYFLIDKKAYRIDETLYIVVSAVEAAIAVGWSYAMFRLVIFLYHKLAATEIKQSLPAPLTFNVGAYAMGPNLFAVIPIAGPLIAIAGSFVALVAAGRKRLFISWRGAVIDTFLVFAVVLVATVALYFVGGLLLDLTGFNAVTPVPAFPSGPKPPM